jgi:hypothetical protein
MQRLLITSGLILLAIGVLYPLITKMGLGSLPGDINVKGERFSFHFPIVTCLLLSALVSVLLWVARKIGS